MCYEFYFKISFFSNRFTLSMINSYVVCTAGGAIAVAVRGAALDLSAIASAAGSVLAPCAVVVAARGAALVPSVIVEAAGGTA